ncbi:amidohydrolase [Salinithrix halophila]|uniref:Amidohydrolase n=1 Tax=Salinithrix halophila TaxID=1485204 RepID=A0ABV8JHC9_9BACL
MNASWTDSKKKRELLAQVIFWRRHLHQYPELSFQERKTADFVFHTLSSFRGLTITRPTPTSVCATLKGNLPGPTVALRADMDALPIQEENDVDYVSRHPGVMHACGHDGHTAMLLGAARFFTDMREELRGELRFLFQHAEEIPPGGARDLVAAGAMEGVDAVLGTHLWSPLPTGKVGVVYGPAMASMDTFMITIRGKGGHAGAPHQTVDSIAVGAQVVSNLQHVVARNMDPLSSTVLSITKFLAGTTHNIIPGSVLIEGSVRTLDEEARQDLPALMERVIRGITSAHGADYQWHYKQGYHAVVNEGRTTQLVEETVRECLGTEALVHMDPIMGGEDFSAYQREAPGAFFFTGIGNKGKSTDYPHHHPRFNIDEDALETGLIVLIHTTLRLLENEDQPNIHDLGGSHHGPKHHPG